MSITITYSSIDRYRQRRTFKSLRGAQRFAHKWVGETPELGLGAGGYAVSGDGVGKITVTGATLLELFPKLAPAPSDEPTDREMPF